MKSLELKVTVPDILKIKERLKIKLENAEKVSELENRPIESTLSKENRESLEKSGVSITWETMSKWSKLHVIWVPKREERKNGAKNFLKKS